MDAAALEAIRVKVNAFRIAEAKEVLQQLGLPRHGRKDDLAARILGMFQDAATLTEQGHKLKDQARVDAAAGIVDKVFQRLLRTDYGPAVAASNKLAGVDQGPPKRARLFGPTNPTNPLLPQQRQFRPLPAAAAGLGGAEDEEDVITAFITGEEGIGPLNTRVRCVCANGGRSEPMLQCEGAFCGVWQHGSCVRQQLLHSRGSDKWPKRRQFFCERCRVARADPFWEVYDTLVMTPQLGRPTGGKATVQNSVNVLEEWQVSKAGPGRITLSSQQVKLLRDSPGEFQLQAMALCLDDKIQFRLQWPTSPLLRFNNRMLRVNQRGTSTPLGVMQRDAPANLTPLLPLVSAQEQGGLMLDVSLEYAQGDKHKQQVLLLAYIMRRRTREQVKALMKPPEPLAVAVQRVRHFMHPRGPETSSTNPAAGAAAAAAGQAQQHAAAAAAADDDIVISDEEDVVVGNRVVSLKDPNTFLRVQHPARFVDTGSNDDQTFELESFLDMAAQTYKWIDPHSMKASCVQNLQLDSYLAHIVSCLAHQPDVLEVEINEEAEWRPAGSNGPFRSVLQADGQTPAPVVGPMGSGGGGEQHSSDEEDEAAELRRAVSEVRRGKQHEVISLLDSDDEDAAQPPQQQPQQQQQRPGGGGGLTINLPSRAQQQQQHLQQQMASSSMAAAAAAAVGPHVPTHIAHGAGPGGHLQPGGGSGVMSPRAVAGNIPQQHQQPHQQQHQHLQQQQQQQQPGFPGQQVWQPNAGIALQQALPPQPGLQYAVHGPLAGAGPVFLVQGGVVLGAAVPMQGGVQQLQQQGQLLQQQQPQGLYVAPGLQQPGGGMGLPPQQHQQYQHQ